MTTTQRLTACRLCNACCPPWCRVDGIQYQACPNCGLIQMNTAHLPSLAAEKACYDWHENDITDAGYRNFLSRLSVPLTQRLPAAARGLDYGCGPGPALAAMLTEQGFPTVGYDPIYYPDNAVLAATYDFITCTEVVEHLHQPQTTFQQLRSMLNPGGWLAIMTAWYDPAIDFQRWHYRRDPTHVCFYQRQTFDWLASTLDMVWESPAKNVALFRDALRCPQQQPAPGKKASQ